MASPPAMRRWQRAKGGGSARLGSVVRVREWAAVALVATAGQNLLPVAEAFTPAHPLNCIPLYGCSWLSALSKRTGPGWPAAGIGVARDDWCDYGHSSGWVGLQRTHPPCMAGRRRRPHVGGWGMSGRFPDRHSRHATAVAGCRGLRICQFSDHFGILNTNASGIKYDFCRNFLSANRICMRRRERKDMNKNTDSIENKSDS